MVGSLLLVLLLAAFTGSSQARVIGSAEQTVVEYMLGPIENRDQIPESFVRKHINDEGYVVHRDLTDVHPKCKAPFTWIEPTWWKTYEQKIGENLKQCNFHRGIPPPQGTRCLATQQDFICLYGTEQCEHGIAGPEDRCECHDGLWTCEKVCAKCPATLPSGPCNPLINDKTCKYNKYCCCGNCFDTSGCSCETWDNKSEWVCYQADILPCSSCLEDVGCPCDRPKIGDACQGDYGCGDGCCGADAYYCTCNDGIYDLCVTSAGIGPFLECKCDL